MQTHDMLDILSALPHHPPASQDVLLVLVLNVKLKLEVLRNYNWNMLVILLDHTLLCYSSFDIKM